MATEGLNLYAILVFYGNLKHDFRRSKKYQEVAPTKTMIPVEIPPSFTEVKRSLIVLQENFLGHAMEIV